MKKIAGLIGALTLAIFLSSCNSEGERNLDNISKLKAGMTKDEVLAIMGKPLEKEIYNKPDLWFYYTESKWSDGNRTSDECTPLVFEDGKLIGWGAEFYKEYRHSKW